MIELSLSASGVVVIVVVVCSTVYSSVGGTYVSLSPAGRIASVGREEDRDLTALAGSTEWLRVTGGMLGD
jgi:hypothetical protein